MKLNVHIKRNPLKNETNELISLPDVNWNHVLKYAGTKGLTLICHGTMLNGSGKHNSISGLSLYLNGMLEELLFIRWVVWHEM